MIKLLDFEINRGWNIIRLVYNEISKWNKFFYIFRKIINIVISY